ncbi:hypothetical protein DAPPUDRAFT_257654 [Daphnia pulex]|uniref:Uncharacterized protein n=1 Tax=Daphnia pulex TaxID=6669 RepID=E9HDZ5_DAPPU|nr:hypothetical protein DAPPUDRAFT_257654 [Daphnia pulex]|eukprot:EFX70044.1 hypothetical protein DAPPUDRAFT_257654 [Daphnia pulex]
MLGRLPDENAINDLIQRADKSSSDNSNMVGEKSNYGDGTGLSADDDEEEEVRLTINNALANTKPEDSFNLRDRKNTQKRIAPFPFILVPLTRPFILF